MIHILFKNEYLVKKNKVQCVNESHVICMFVYLLYITHVFILNMQDSSSMENEFSCSCDVMGCTCLYVLVTVNMPQY